MASKVHSRNGIATETPKTVTESEIRASDAVKTKRTVEAAPEKEVDHPTVTELIPAAEMTILTKVHSENGTAAQTPETEIPLTAAVATEQTVGAEVKEAPEKEAKRVSDHPTVTEVAGAAETTIPKTKWPGWPGDRVIRVIVPVHKVQSIIGRNGDTIKKMCEETKANIRVLKGPVCDPNCIVQISSKEDIEAPLSPSMNAVIRVFKCVNGFPENESGGVPSIPICSIWLLVRSIQARSLIGMQQSPIKTIQKNTGCSVRIMSCGEVSTLCINSDDRVVDIQGEGLKVLQALEAVHRHLHMFLVAQTMQIPLVDAVDIMRAERTSICLTVQESIISSKRITVEIRGTSSQVQAAQKLIQAKTETGPGRAIFEPVRRVAGQVVQTMRIPLVDAVGIIAVEGTSFGCTSGAIFTVQDSKISRKRITVEIKGSLSQVETAQQLIQAKTGAGPVSFGPVRLVDVDQPLTRPGPGKKHPCSTLPPPHIALGEVSHEPQAAGPLVLPLAKTSPPSAATEAQNEPTICSSLVEVPLELPQVQHATAFVAIESKDVPPKLHQVQPVTGFVTLETKAEVPPKLAQVQLVTKADVPPEMPQVQPATALQAIETKAEVPPKLPQVQSQTKAEAEVPPELPQVQPASELMTIETEAEVPPESAQVQPTIETKADLPTKLPQVQPISALGSIETRAEDPVVAVSSDDLNVVDEPKPMEMEFEESIVQTGPIRAFPRSVQDFFGQRLAFPGPGKHQERPPALNVPTFHPPNHTARRSFRTGIDQALTRRSLNQVHLYKDLTPPSHHCRRRPMSPPHHVTAAPSGMESFNEPKQTRVYWNVNIVKTFLDACIHEIAINGREEGSLKAMSWKKVGEILKDRHNFSVDSKQMKNYYDGLKKKYGAWLLLKNKTKNKYDPSTNMFNLTDKEWEKEMKKDKWVQTLRNAPLPFPNLCARLFDSVISTAIESPGLNFGEHIAETNIQKDTMSLPSPSTPVNNKKRKGEVTHEPQAAGPLVSPLAQTSPLEAPVEPQKEPKRIRVSLDVNIVKTFLDAYACIHEIATNGWEGGSLKAMSWQKVEEILRDRHNFSFDHSQMKSYFNGLKSKYRAWLLLKNKFANKYDPSTNTFNLTDEEWETEMKENKCIESLRKAPLRFPDRCAQLFDGVISTGFLQTTATSPSAETSPPLATTETPHEGECEVTEPQKACSSLLQVPPDLPQLQPATALNVAIETKADVPPKLPQVQPATAPKAIETKSDVPPELPQVQPATALKAIETKADVPPELPRVQPATAHEAIETKPQEPVVPAKTRPVWDRLGPVRPVVLNMPTFHPGDWTAPGVDQAFTGPAHHGKKRPGIILPSPHITSSPSENFCSGEALYEPQEAVALLPPSGTETPQKERMVEVPRELPQVQPATALNEIETNAEVLPELPQVQPATTFVAIETEAEDATSLVSPSSSNPSINNQQKKGKRSMSVIEEEILGVLKMIADKITKPQPPSKPTFEDCENKLNELGWPKNDPLHLLALTIFCDEKNHYRELWMKLDTNLCADWVRMIGRSKRFT